MTGAGPADRLEGYGPGGWAGLPSLGLAAGFLSSFLGIGGGLVIGPVLMALFRQPIKRAIGTSLAAIVPVSIVGVLAESAVERANIHWGAALVLTAGSIAGSWAGSHLIPRIRDLPLRLAYVALLLLASYRMLVGSADASGAGPLRLESADPAGTIVAVISGALAGLASVLFGIGGGIVIVPALTILFTGFSFHAARATSLVTIVPTAAYGAWRHGRLGNVDRAIAWRLVPTGLVGAVAGVLSVNQLPARPCKLAFGLFLAIAALRLVWQARGELGRS